MNLHEQTQRFRNDAEFHALVRQFRSVLERGRFSIGECKGALNLAANMVAQEHIAPLVEKKAEAEEPKKVEGPAAELTADCSGCGNFFTPESPEDKMCKECLQQEVEEAHDEGRCGEGCLICADEGRGRKGEGDGR